jgi:hypothetical protein
VPRSDETRIAGAAGAAGATGATITGRAASTACPATCEEPTNRNNRQNLRQRTGHDHHPSAKGTLLIIEFDIVSSTPTAKQASFVSLAFSRLAKFVVFWRLLFSKV